jgi:hypothetical protein
VVRFVGVSDGPLTQGLYRGRRSFGACAAPRRNSERRAGAPPSKRQREYAAASTRAPSNPVDAVTPPRISSSRQKEARFCGPTSFDLGPHERTSGERTMALARLREDRNESSMATRRGFAALPAGFASPRTSTHTRMDRGAIRAGLHFPLPLPRFSPPCPPLRPPRPLPPRRAASGPPPPTSRRASSPLPGTAACTSTPLP